MTSALFVTGTGGLQEAASALRTCRLSCDVLKNGYISLLHQWLSSPRSTVGMLKNVSAGSIITGERRA